MPEAVLDKETKVPADVEKPDWNPSEEQKARIQFVYSERDDMLWQRNQTYVQFNDRTLKEFIDDSEKRLNAYVLDKASQGKEDWQANFATRAYANKSKALLAAAARDLPDMHFRAVSEDQRYDYVAADIMKSLTRYSYYTTTNIQTDLFFLGWSLLGKGTVLSYEGFQKQYFKKKRIKSYDLLTGEVDYEELESSSEGEPVSFEIPLMNLLIKNFYIRDIQQQPAICWDTFYADRERFWADWGKFPNTQFVKDAAALRPEEHDTYFHKHWSEAVIGKKGYVVSRYLNRWSDIYRVVANGVELYNGPMLWMDISSARNGQKVYPIAKEIFEPFADGNFFYGNSLPNSAMGEGDVLNTLYNTSLDKQYRSMVPPLLVGMINKDMLDLEDEVVAGDTKIYVEDITQVKQLDIKGISDSDVKMIELISRGLDLTTLDPSQQGAAERYVTARAAVAADERARQLKGLFFMFLESLWLQKVKLRVPNILLSYTRPQLVEVIGEEGTRTIEARYRTFNIEGTELSDGTKGTMAIQFAPSRDAAMMMRTDIEEEETRHRRMGRPFEKVGVVYDYLERFSYDVQIIPETLWQSSQSLGMALAIEKITTISTYFPEYFAANKPVLFKELLKKYGDDPERYELPQPQTFEEQQLGEMMKGRGGGSKTSPNSQLVSDITGTDMNNRLSKLTGVEV